MNNVWSKYRLLHYGTTKNVRLKIRFSSMTGKNVKPMLVPLYKNIHLLKKIQFQWKIPE